MEMEVVEVEFAPVLLQEFGMELEWGGAMLLRVQWVKPMRVLLPLLLRHYLSSDNHGLRLNSPGIYQ